MGGFPRIRGDVPQIYLGQQQCCGFSPHTRGCSVCHCRQKRHNQVFPAYAGMFRPTACGLKQRAGFPRIRGDVPENNVKFFTSFRFSPHTRGCSSSPPPPTAPEAVFPAYAGMFRCTQPYFKVSDGFPRIRGDVPPYQNPSQEESGFSPHTRGCSRLSRLRLLALSFPRIRGDVPNGMSLFVVALAFSPHTRGCSVFNITIVLWP